MHVKYSVALRGQKCSIDDIYSLDWLKAPPIRNIVAKNAVTDDLLLEAIFSSERFAVQPQLSGMT